MSRPSTPLFRTTAPARIPSRSRRYATCSCILLTSHTFAAMVGHDGDAAPNALSDAERLDWLRLIRTENVGPIGFRHLLQRFGGARAALDALPQLARRAGRMRPLKLCPAAEAEREME